MCSLLDCYGTVGENWENVRNVADWLQLFLFTWYEVKGPPTPSCKLLPRFCTEQPTISSAGCSFPAGEIKHVATVWLNSTLLQSTCNRLLELLSLILFNWLWRTPRMTYLFAISHSFWVFLLWIPEDIGFSREIADELLWITNAAVAAAFVRNRFECIKKATNSLQNK